jgi:hypothetical protein
MNKLSRLYPFRPDGVAITSMMERHFTLDPRLPQA